MKTEQIILEYLKEHIKEHGYAPSIREIRDGCGLSSTSVAVYHLDKMEDDGILTRERSKARAIVIHDA